MAANQKILQNRRAGLKGTKLGDHHTAMSGKEEFRLDALTTTKKKGVIAKKPVSQSSTARFKSREDSNSMFASLGGEEGFQMPKMPWDK